MKTPRLAEVDELQAEIQRLEFQTRFPARFPDLDLVEANERLEQLMLRQARIKRIIS
jgi:hypothetical protein